MCKHVLCTHHTFYIYIASYAYRFALLNYIAVAGLGLQWWVWIGIAAGILLLLVLLTWCCCLCRRRSMYTVWLIVSRYVYIKGLCIYYGVANFYLNHLSPGQRKRAEWIAKQDREATAASESRAEKYAARKEESAARARALKDKYNMLNDSTGDIELPSDAKPVTL